jgi:hypothetical protein
VPMAGTFRCRPVSGYRCVASSASGSWGRRGAGRRRRRSIFQRRFGVAPIHVISCRPPLVRAPYLSRMEATYEGSVRCTRSLCTCPLRPPAFDFICVFAGQVYRDARVCYVAVASRRVASIPLPSTSARVRVVGGICHRTPPRYRELPPVIRPPLGVDTWAEALLTCSAWVSGLRLGFSPCKGPGPPEGGCLGLPWASGSVPRSRDPTRAPLSSRLEYRLFADHCILNHSVRVGSFVCSGLLFLGDLCPAWFGCLRSSSIAQPTCGCP